MNIFLAAFCFCFLQFSTLAQSLLQLDSTGKVRALTFLPAGMTGGYNLPVSIERPSHQLEALRQALLQKVMRTRANITASDFSFKAFYESLWGKAVLDSIVNELDQQIAYFKTPNTSPYSYQYLPATSVYFDPIFVNWNPELYYRINNQPLQNPFPLSALDYSQTSKAYNVAIDYTDPYKDFLIHLYNHSITQPDASALRMMGTDEFHQTLPAQLQTLKTEIQRLSTISLESYTDKTKSAIDELHYELTKNKLVRLVKSSNFFKNWIWLTEGELTLNPLEVKGSDTGRQTRNRSLTEFITHKTALLAIVLVPVKESNTRYVMYSAQPDGRTSTDTTALQFPFSSKEQLAVLINNITPAETVSVRETAAIPIRSPLIVETDSITTVMDILNGQLHPMLEIWSKVTEALNPLPPTSLDTKSGNVIDNISDAYGNSKGSIITSANRKQLLSAIKKDLVRYHSFNSFLFQETLTLLENIPDFRANSVNTKDIMTAFVANFLVQYEGYFKDYANTKKQLQADSLVAANFYTILIRSSLPPAPLKEAGMDNTAPRYRTEIHLTGTKEHAVDRYFEITKYLESGGMIRDSSTIGSFIYKVGKTSLLRTSAGIAFTIPSRYYSQNWVSTDASGMVKVETKREIVRMVAGVHLYPGKLYMQDEHILGSKDHPWYSRLSLFAGLGIPKPLQNYYPGLSYDIVPGLRLVGGAHLYRHNRYTVENNVVTEQTARINFAGGFVSLNLDPSVVINTIGLFNK